MNMNCSSPWVDVSDVPEEAAIIESAYVRMQGLPCTSSPKLRERAESGERREGERSAPFLLPFLIPFSSFPTNVRNCMGKASVANSDEVASVMIPGTGPLVCGVNWPRTIRNMYGCLMLSSSKVSEPDLVEVAWSLTGSGKSGGEYAAMNVSLLLPLSRPLQRTVTFARRPNVSGGENVMVGASMLTAVAVASRVNDHITSTN